MERLAASARAGEAATVLAWHRRGFRLFWTWVLTALRSPWQNAYVECLIGSIRREWLDHVIVTSGVGLAARTRGRRRVLHEHEDAPDSRQGRTGATTRHEASVGRIVEIPLVNGLPHRHDRLATLPLVRRFLFLYPPCPANSIGMPEPGLTRSATLPDATKRSGLTSGMSTHSRWRESSFRQAPVRTMREPNHDATLWVG